MTYRVAVDAGGTFTDAVVTDDGGRLLLGKAHWKGCVTTRPAKSLLAGRATNGAAGGSRKPAARLLVPGAHSLERGLWFVSSAHGEEDVERTLAAAAEALSTVVDERSAR